MRWADVTSARVITTSAGPWREDVFFVLESAEGKGCIVPHEAAVRTKLRDAGEARRLAVVDDRKVIEVMGSTSKGDFVIWELTAKS